MFGISGNSLLMGVNSDIDVGWTPNQANVPLHMWYRASSVVLNGNKVYQLNNKDLGGESAKAQVQTDPVKQPIFNNSDVNYNGKPTISFDGSQYFQSGTFADTIGGANPMTMIIVGDANLISAFVSNGLDTDTYNILYITPAGEIHYYQTSSNSGSLDTFDTQRLGIYFESTGASLIRCFVNDWTDGFDVINLIDDFNPINNFSVGFGGAGVGSCVGTIAEVIVYKGLLDSTSKTNLKNYLNTRYLLSITS